jgi:putative addiction module component (TIGR02574 family)
MHAQLLEQIRLLPSKEQVELVEEILEGLPDVVEENTDPNLSLEEVAELESRISEFDADPSSGVPWSEVQREINKRFGFNPRDKRECHLSRDAPNQRLRQTD